MENASPHLTQHWTQLNEAYLCTEPICPPRVHLCICCAPAKQNPTRWPGTVAITDTEKLKKGYEAWREGHCCPQGYILWLSWWRNHISFDLVHLLMCWVGRFSHLGCLFAHSSSEGDCSCNCVVLYFLVYWLNPTSAIKTMGNKFPLCCRHSHYEQILWTVQPQICSCCWCVTGFIVNLHMKSVNMSFCVVFSFFYFSIFWQLDI